MVLAAALIPAMASAQDLPGTPFNPSQPSALGDDLGSGHRYIRSLSDNYQDWGTMIVQAEDGFPVRLGDRSLRFETREGFCGRDGNFWSDCNNGRNRHELSTSSDPDPGNRDLWYALSVYIPEEFDSPRNFGTTIFQFWSGGLDSWSFKYDTGKGFYLRRNLDFSDTVLASDFSAKGRWIDVLFRIRHTERDTGSMAVWIDGENVYDYVGRTNAGDNSNAPNYFKFGIYNTALGTNGQPVDGTANGDGEGLPNLHMFFDEVRYADSCAGLSLGNLGYDCADFSYEGADLELVKRLQGALNALGCDVGGVDGVIGRRTLDEAKNCRWFGPGALPDVVSVSSLPSYVSLYEEAVAENMTASTRLEITNTNSELVGGNNDNALTIEATFGDLDLGFILVGNFAENGTTAWLSLLFLENLSAAEEEAVLECRGVRTQHWGDGSIHADFHFLRRSATWVQGDAECLLEALPASAAKEFEYLLSDFRTVAETLRAEGYGGVEDEGLSRFIEQVAEGEVTIGN